MNPLLRAALEPLLTLRMLLFMVGGLAAQLAGAWVASRVLARDEATVLNALRWYGYNLIAYLGCTLAAFVLYALAALMGLGALWMLSAAWLAALVYFAFMIPMGIYRVSAPRALGMIVIAWALPAAVSIAVSLTLGGPVTRESAERAMAAVQKSAAPKLPALGSQVSPQPSAPPTPSSPGAAPPSKARRTTLVRSVRLAVKLDGKVKGDVEVEKGQSLEVLGVEGDRVKVRYLDWTATIPRDATDL